jgi:hypothetical protein
VLLNADDTLGTLSSVLESSELIVGANIAYDFGVACARWSQLIPLVFSKYERCQVYDILIMQALDAIAGGHLYRHPETGERLKINGKYADRYSLELCALLELGHTAKDNDAWRLRYKELSGVSFDQWPEIAIQYPIDDARNTLGVALSQVARKARNAHELSRECRAQWSMHLGSVRGLRTDELRVSKLKEKIREHYEKDVAQFRDVGLITAEGKENGKLLKILVARAYGASQQCTECTGGGKVTSKKTGKPINCPRCASSGLEIPADAPRTKSGGWATDRDTLVESGDPLLEAYAELSKLEKIRDTYIPYLETGISTAINVKPNVLVESGRASYDGLVQLLPREHGVRETHRARDGFVFCSIDYSALELATLAQVCLWLFGKSSLADDINSGLDVHTSLAADLFGLKFEDLQALVNNKDHAAKEMRRVAKAINFGLPGGMGPGKMVLANRKVGLRFCQSINHSPECGVKKTMLRDMGNNPYIVCSECLDLAKQLKKRWLHVRPEMHEYFNWVTREIERAGVDGEAEIISLGSSYIRAGLSFSSFANHSFQHLASRGAKQALWDVTKECFVDRGSPMWGCRPLLFLHDEIFSELPEAKASAAALRMTDVMISSMKTVVPDVKITAEPAIMRYWSKEASSVWSEKGELLIWEPKS